MNWRNKIGNKIWKYSWSNRVLIRLQFRRILGRKLFEITVIEVYGLMETVMVIKRKLF